MRPENITKPPVEVFQEAWKNTSAKKWVKYIFNKYVSRMLIFTLAPQQNILSYSRSALFLSVHSKGNIQCFMI